MERTIYVIAEKSSPRLEYVLGVIFQSHLHLSFEMVSEYSECPSDAYIIDYSVKAPEENCLTIYQHPILLEDQIYAQRIEVLNDNGLPYFFQSFSYKRDYSFDLFAVVFYMLSRYEEYLRFAPDQHGRFSAYQSLAHRSDFLLIPIVDRWILHLKRTMEQKWGIDIPINRSFQIAPTMDIDTPYAYLHRPFIYHLGAIGRDIFLGRWNRLGQRWSTYTGKERDLFDTYDHIFQLIEKHKEQAVFFFLMNLKLPDDQNFSVGSRAFKALVRTISAQYQIGIHPSLQSHYGSEQWRQERDKLEAISGQKIKSSRQHFLKLSFPASYQALVGNGIIEDYSMAFHDSSGFRAGTSIPFQWYDLKKEKAENLKIYPHVTMDATLRHYEKLNSQEAIDKVISLKEEVKSVEGRFSFIWHNSSFADMYGWAEWKEVLEEVMI